MSGHRSVTELLQASRGGDEAAFNELLPAVYDQLRKVAAKHMRSEREGHTLGATALVHEAYVRLVDAEISFEDRAHFFATAATMMRRILVDHAKQRGRHKRGGNAPNLSLDEAAVFCAEPDSRILDIDEALIRLAVIDERKARVIELVFFGGLNHDEAARAMGISDSTLNRELKFAKAWILNEIKPRGGD